MVASLKINFIWHQYTLIYCCDWLWCFDNKTEKLPKHARVSFVLPSQVSTATAINFFQNFFMLIYFPFDINIGFNHFDPLNFKERFYLLCCNELEHPITSLHSDFDFFSL